jgi:hypothetical protein
VDPCVCIFHPLQLLHIFLISSSVLTLVSSGIILFKHRNGVSKMLHFPLHLSLARVLLCYSKYHADALFILAMHESIWDSRAEWWM